MKQFVVIGRPEFTLGFQLTGIREVVTLKSDEKEFIINTVRPFLARQDLAIVIIDEPTMQILDERTHDEAVSSLSPVFVVVSATAQQDALRKMIRQSIGVDLMKES